MTLSRVPAENARDDVLIALRGVSKGYRRGGQTLPVLSDISFDIRRAEFLALMGPSGSGKSTLLNLIAGLDSLDSGSIEVGGKDITRLRESDLANWRAAHVGFIFQFYNLMPVLTALENVELPLSLKSMGRSRQTSALRTLGWAAAARGDRKGNCHRPDAPGGRRTNRRPRSPVGG